VGKIELLKCNTGFEWTKVDISKFVSSQTKQSKVYTRTERGEINGPESVSPQIQMLKTCTITEWSEINALELVI
jgi:hypothetical protein